jgi:spore germination protein GerM
MVFKINRVVFIILLVCLSCRSGVGANQEEISSPGEVVESTLFDGFLYFADNQGYNLKALAQQFPSNLSSHELGCKILETLLAGPPDSALAPTFPTDTRLVALFISEDGRAWVDLGLREGQLKNVDTVSELLAIYSVVNSLTLNIPGVKQVKLLVNGSDVETLGGHVSLKYFYKTNMLIVK